MNAPYDGDRGQGAGGAGSSSGPPVPPGAGQDGEAPDPYLQHAYDHDPYRAQDLAAQDPVAEALYDRAAHPPPPPGTYQEPQALYQQPPAAQHAPDPRIWAQTPPPEPAGPSRHLPYGDHAATTQYVGVDDLVTQASGDRDEQDAFAHLFRDQEAVGRPPPSRRRPSRDRALSPLRRRRSARRSPAAPGPGRRAY